MCVCVCVCVFMQIHMCVSAYVQAYVQRTALDIVSQVLSTITFETGFFIADQPMNSSDLPASASSAGIVST